MNALLLIVALATLGGVVALAPADGGGAALACLPVAAVAAWFIYKAKIDEQFLIRLFFAALLARIFVGTMIFVLHQQSFFGGDA